MPNAVVAVTHETTPFNENADRILHKRYYERRDEYPVCEWCSNLKDEDGNLPSHVVCHESVDQFFARISFGNNQYEYELFRPLVFMVNSPTLFNAGTVTGGTLSACFKFDVPDNMEGILDVAKKAGMVLKAGGGVGYVVSDVRAKGAHVNSTHRKALGPLGCLDIYQVIARQITQGGKRDGAQMGILHCDHEDIREFIHMKDKNPEDMETFNISVALTDEFMGHATAEDPSMDNDPAHLLREMAESAWKTGDPGCFFIDTVERYNPTPWIGQLTGTNPCLAKGTLVATKNGWYPVEEIAQGDEIGTIFGSGHVKTKEVHDDLPVFKVSFRDGGEVFATGAHQFHAIRSGSKQAVRYEPIRLDQLKEGDWVRTYPAPMPDKDLSLPAEFSHLSQREFGFLCGVLIGDGCYTEKNLARNRVTLAVGGEDKEWQEVASSVIEYATGRPALLWADPNSNSWNLYQSSKAGLASFVREAGLTPAYSHEKDVPDYFLQSNREAMAGMIDGLFSADGNVHLSGNTAMLRLSSTSLTLLRSVRRMLLCFGISSSIRPRKSASYIQGRSVNARPSWQLHVMGHGMKTFAKEIGISHPERKNKLDKARRWFCLTGGLWRTTIESIEPAGTAQVFDLFESKSDTWIGEGYVSRGCGEVPLLNDEACNLASINLAKFVVGHGFDAIRLVNTVRLAVRYLDDVIENNVFPDPLITEAVRLTRKIGLGVMGWADALALMGIPYDSEEAVELAGVVSDMINRAAHTESVLLGQERGNYPGWELGAQWRAENDVEDDHFLYGARRNATVTCIAPTGTIAIIAGASGGIEPHFAIEWKRVTGDNIEMMESIPVKEHLPHGFIPPTAMEIAPEWHIKHQAAWSHNVDLACSKTINMPDEATVEDIRQAYIMMWKTECRGGTIYRNGSRDVQVLTVETAADVPPVVARTNGATPAPAARRKMPETRNSITHKFSVGDVEGYVHVGLYDDGTPGEVFLDISKQGSTIGGLADELAIFMSMGLQYGVPLDEFIRKMRQTRFEPSGLTGNSQIRIATSLIDYLGHWLEQTFLNGEVVHVTETGMTCPECGNGAIPQEGCLTCPTCGWSRC